jgi:hypothetical protein
MTNEHKPHRYDIFQHFAQNHNLTLLESEIEDICQVVNRQLCEEKTRLMNEIVAAKQELDLLKFQLGAFAIDPNRIGQCEIAMARAANTHLAEEKELHRETFRNLTTLQKVARDLVEANLLGLFTLIEENDDCYPLPYSRMRIACDKLRESNTTYNNLSPSIRGE